MGWIYLLYDEAGKGYIGQTTNINKRLSVHKSTSNDTCSKYLGEWKCERLEEVENDCLEDFERYWYDFYNEMFPGMLVNKQQPQASGKERQKKHRESNKKYRINNLENIREKEREYAIKYRLNKKLKKLSLKV